MRHGKKPLHRRKEFWENDKHSGRRKRHITKKGEEDERNVCEDLELDEYDKEMKKAYWFPYQGKYVAWGISMTTIFSCSVALVLYGITFGEVKGKLWLATVFSSMALSVFFVQPSKVLLFAAVSSYILKLERRVTHKPLTKDLLHNPPNEEKLNEVRKLRETWASCYTPPDPSTMRKQKIELRNIIEMESLVLDMFQYILFMVTLYILIMSNRTDTAYHSNMTLRRLIVDGSYTNSISLMSVISLEQFVEYMNETFIPALMQNETAWMMEQQNLKGSLTPIPGNDTLQTPVVNRGFTRDHHFKLLGRPRLRQKRVHSSTCNVHEAAIPTRQGDCFEELSPWNEDVKNYDLGWQELNANEPLASDRERDPWTYRTAWENQAMPYIGRMHRFLVADGAGYSVQLGKTVENSRTVLDFLLYFNWIDSRTRVLYIDFATYSVGANLFNVVTIIIEISATGVLIPTFKIHTNRLLYLQIEMLMTTAVFFVIFITFIALFAVREGVKMKRASFKVYFTEGWSVIDLLIVLFGSAVVVSAILRLYYVGYLLQKLDSSANNEFVSFQYAAQWDQITTSFNGLLICLATVKAFRLLTFKVRFQRWDQVLRDSWRPLLGLYVILLACVFAFAVFFYLILGKHDERFTVLWSSFPCLLAHTTRRHDEFDGSFLYHVPPYLGATFYGCFLGFASYLMVSIFTTVLSVHLKAIQNQPVRSHYHVLTYFKSLLRPNIVVPAPPITPLPQPITLRTRQGRNLIPLPSVDEVRLQGLKRETLLILTGKDYFEDTALNIAHIVLSGNMNRPGTDQYNIVREDAGDILVEEAKVKKMKEIADTVVEERNIMVKEQLKIKI